jgi:hypothetical protein
MLNGSFTLLITGLALVTLEEFGPDPVNHVKIAIKLLLITVVIVVLVAKNRKFATIPADSGALSAALTIANAAVAVLWQ